MENRTELGSIQIHRNALAEIITAAITEISGVRLIENNFFSSVIELFGEKQYPGIQIHFDDQHHVTVHLKVSLRFGLSIPETAKIIQVLVKKAIEKAVDVNLKEVNVNIHSIDRG